MTLFSIDATALDDPRLQRLPPSTFKAWFGLKCVAARCGGALPDILTLAFMLRSRLAVLERRIAVLREAGLIEERAGGLWIVDDTPPPDPPPPRHDPDDGFNEFWDTFPKRDGDNPREPALIEFRKAVSAGADPKAIIAAAKAYASATAARERRYVASAARWLGERRWRGETPATNQNLGRLTTAPSVWISATSPEWRAWADRWRETKGKSPPVDAKGGWRFPSLNPPEPQPMAA